MDDEPLPEPEFTIEPTFDGDDSPPNQWALIALIHYLFKSRRFCDTQVSFVTYVMVDQKTEDGKPAPNKKRPYTHYYARSPGASCVQTPQKATKLLLPTMRSNPQDRTVSHIASRVPKVVPATIRKPKVVAADNAMPLAESLLGTFERDFKRKFYKQGTTGYEHVPSAHVAQSDADPVVKPLASAVTSSGIAKTKVAQASRPKTNPPPKTRGNYKKALHADGAEMLLHNHVDGDPGIAARLFIYGEQMMAASHPYVDGASVVN
ncbi:hypothetical protein B0H14DRAFT_3579828 [Mycena olivaceomarginata]|nr:hypothetical protein B0H14DRAFT_3579828 [Mycena olivaceomarginata]